MSSSEIAVRYERALVRADHGLETRFKREWDRFERLGRLALEQARVVGEVLRDIKTDVGHGGWYGWLQAHNLQEDRAERLMRLADPRNTAVLRDLAPDTPIAGALQAISAARRAARADRLATERQQLVVISDRSSPETRIFTADAARTRLASESVDLIVTSPPYRTGQGYGLGANDNMPYSEYLYRVEGWVLEIERILKWGGRAAINVPLDTHRGADGRVDPRPVYADWTHTLGMADDLHYRSSITWTKGSQGNVTKSVARGSLDSPNAILPLSGVEMVILVSKGDWHLGRTGEPSDLSRAEWLQWTNGLWRFPNPNPNDADEQVEWPNLEWDFVPARGDVRGHPAPMASEMAHRLIKMLSFPDAIVYDPFCGSGTTPGEAIKLGRLAWGSDIEATWVGVTERYTAECASQL